MNNTMPPGGNDGKAPSVGPRSPERPSRAISPFFIIPLMFAIGIAIGYFGNKYAIAPENAAREEKNLALLSESLNADGNVNLQGSLPPPNTPPASNTPEINIPAPSTRAITLYFNNGTFPEDGACETVFPVRREVADTSAENVVRQLLAGPRPEEMASGYYTSISPGVAVHRVDLGGATVIVDLSAHLGYRIVPGSCRAAAIRSQIIQTLRPYAENKTIIITLDGRGENLFNE